MGLCLIESLAPGERSDPAACEIRYTWNAGDLVLGDDGSAHVCLLASVLALDDGITFPGYATVLALGDANPSPSFVPWDNNLAQQNVVDEFTEGEDGTLDFEVHNPSNQGTRTPPTTARRSRILIRRTPTATRSATPATTARPSPIRPSSMQTRTATETLATPTSPTTAS
jgi:hypothetical protein